MKVHVKETVDYELGVEMSRITSRLYFINAELEKKDIDVEPIRVKVGEILNSLRKMHDLMAAE